MSVGGLLSTTLASSPLLFPTRFKAIAFDAFAIFDSRPVFTLVNSLFPEKANELINTWRTKQFEYSWLRTAAGQYENFWKVTEDALLFAAKKAGVSLTANSQKQLMDQYLSLSIWPDVLPALQTFKDAGIRLAFLSNMTAEMLNASIRNSRIGSYFDHVISTDSAKTYKPARVAYQLAIDKLKLKKEEIAFVAFAGWDVAGSHWFGYPTFWLNRSNAPSEQLYSIPDNAGSSMDDLVNFINQKMHST